MAWGDLARPDQLLPAGDWRTWLILAGRGWGKTRTGAEAVREWKEHYPRIGIIAPTFADGRDTCIEGEGSGLKAICPPGEIVKWNRSMGELEFSNGARCKLFSSDEPERLRGPQHHKVWADELGAWRYPDATWDMAMFGLRLGDSPQAVVTTTPKPIRLIRELLKAASTHVTRGSTYDNRANLAAAFFDQIIGKYEGTRLGRQELMADVLDDTPGALWTWGQIDAARCKPGVVPTLTRVVVAIDPAVTSTDESAETGIIACGLGTDGHGYVLDDKSGRYTPDGWGGRAVALLDAREGDRIIGEANNGGDMVEHVIRTVRKNAPYRKVYASRGKRTRAEPVAALYEQGKIHHVGTFAVLEDQMTTWDAAANAASPDRMDALVWAMTDLMLGGKREPDWSGAKPFARGM